MVKYFCAITVAAAVAALDLSLAAKAGFAAPDTPVVFDMGATTTNVNVMKNAMPALPTFPKLAPKRGYVRGYVFDQKGKPLAGARLGIRSTAVGGFYSGAQGKTDARGYYEIAVPWGAASFYNAGYSVDYGEGRAALGLHPADGEADSFASAKGVVENWVLLPYGIADRDGAQERPDYMNNYYGGGIHISYGIHDGSIFAGLSDMPPGSQIEVRLTPDGPLLDGTTGRAFLIRKPVSKDSISTINVTNIPVGRYKIAVGLVPPGGGSAAPLRLKEVGPNRGSAFGIAPKNGVGPVTLLLRPNGASAERANAAHGNWDNVSIDLERTSKSSIDKELPQASARLRTPKNSFSQEGYRYFSAMWIEHKRLLRQGGRGIA
jgi:hypothetical protein